jgi:hemoglobin-like flavoprotein
MGSAASVSPDVNSGKGTIESSSKKTSISSFFAIGKYLEPCRIEAPAPVIDLYRKSVCEASWENIKAFVGIKPFCGLFFQIFAATDESVCNLFRPRMRIRRRQFAATREGLLMHVVEYLVSVEDDNFETKKRIRALGRKHLLSGIKREHIKVFNDVFITTLLNIPDIRECLITMSSWTGLLDFMANEMYIEDIQLVVNRSVDSDIEKITDLEIVSTLQAE